MKGFVKYHISLDMTVLTLVSLAFIFERMYQELLLNLIMLGVYVLFSTYHQKIKVHSVHVIWFISLCSLSLLVALLEIPTFFMVSIKDYVTVYQDIDIILAICLVFISLYVFLHDIFKKGIK